jgi:excisionase family DNA binding protein
MMRLTANLSTPFKPASTPQPMPDLADFMTTKEASQELGFTVPGVHKLIKRLQLESLAVGKIMLVSRASVKAYIEQTKGMSKNDPTRGKPSQD